MVTKATINQPSRKEYKKVEDVFQYFARKVDSLLSDENPLNEWYDLLDASNAGLSSALTRYEEVARLAANNQLLLAQDAARMAMLKGPPPPEETASAPLIGKARDRGPLKPIRDRGRQALRIDRNP